METIQMQYVDPEREQFEQFKALPRDTPIHMLNLIKLKDSAAYTDGTVATGAEAYAAYGRDSGPIFKRVGGKMLWRGKPESMVIGPMDEQWDMAFIAYYPNSGAFLEMVTDPDYQQAVKHRQAAVETSRLLRQGELPAGDILV
jgi:uncharacterized protein (DUF1330 family)